jgi:hypothetical protein
LYSETGWTTLSSGRHNRKLQLFYNIKNGHAPNYLGDLIPPTVQSTTIYPFRNGSDLIIPFRERPFNLKGGRGGVMGFFLKKYSDYQCC